MSQAFLEDPVAPRPQIISLSVLEITFSAWRFLGLSKSIPVSLHLNIKPPGHGCASCSQHSCLSCESSTLHPARQMPGTLIVPRAGATQSDAKAVNLGPGEKQALASENYFSLQQCSCNILGHFSIQVDDPFNTLASQFLEVFTCPLLVLTKNCATCWITFPPRHFPPLWLVIDANTSSSNIFTSSGILTL